MGCDFADDGFRPTDAACYLGNGLVGDYSPTDIDGLSDVIYVRSARERKPKFKG